MHCSTHRNRHRLLGAHAARNRAYTCCQCMYMSQLHASLASLLHAVTSSVSCQSSSHAYSGSCSVQREHSSQWLKMQAPLRVMHCGAPNSLSRWLRFLAALHVLMLCKATPLPLMCASVHVCMLMMLLGLCGLVRCVLANLLFEPVGQEYSGATGELDASSFGA